MVYTVYIYIYIFVCMHFMNIIGNVPKNDDDFIVMQLELRMSTLGCLDWDEHCGMNGTW